MMVFSAGQVACQTQSLSTEAPIVTSAPPTGTEDFGDTSTLADPSIVMMLVEGKLIQA